MMGRGPDSLPNRAYRWRRQAWFHLVDPWWSRIGVWMKFTGCRMIHGRHLWKSHPEQNLWTTYTEMCESCGKRREPPPVSSSSPFLTAREEG